MHLIIPNTVPELYSPKNVCEEETEISDYENRGYLLIRLRRRKSLQRSIHIDPIALLDQSYYGITNTYLKHSSKWQFNTFTLDVMTGGHSLSSLLFHFFIEYGFIDTFKLDVINVMRCFRESRCPRCPQCPQCPPCSLIGHCLLFAHWLASVHIRALPIPHE